MAEFKSALAIHCGHMHTVLIPGSGRSVIGWGTAPNGELSTEEGFSEFDAGVLTLPRSWISGGKNAEGTQAGVGTKHTALLFDGRVFTMGSREGGRLGHDGKRYGRVVFPGGDEPIELLAVGSAFNIAVGSGGRRMYSWGVGAQGNLGIGRRVDSAPYPVHFSIPGARRARRVSCGSTHVLALCHDGTVWSWGGGDGGRLGHGNTRPQLTPRLVQSLVASWQDRVTDIAAGDFHSMALNTHGDVYTWGSGGYGRLGLGTVLNHYTPTLIPAFRDKTVTAISCSTYHSLAVVKASGFRHTLFTWGGGQYGKLGHKGDQAPGSRATSGRRRPRSSTATTDKGGRNWSNSLTPRPVSYFGLRVQEAVVQAACGRDFTVCVTKSGGVYAWGYTANRRCGYEPRAGGFSSSRSRTADMSCVGEPQRINRGVPGLEPRDVVGFQVTEKEAAEITQQSMVQQVSCGAQHTVARLGDAGGGYLMAWGSNHYGQVGTGVHETAHTPLPVLVCHPRAGSGSLKSGDTKTRHAGATHTAEAAGYGVGQSLGSKAIVTRGAMVTDISCGDFHTLAVTRDGSVFAWGSNSHGQLGLGLPHSATVTRPRLVELMQGTDIRKVEAGGRHSACVPVQPSHNRARIFVWGDGCDGQLGLGRDVKTVATPQLLLLSSDDESVGRRPPRVSVSLGINHSLFLVRHAGTSSGGRVKKPWSEVMACGSGRYGRLGLGDFDNRYHPTRVTRWDSQVSEGGTKGGSRAIEPEHTAPFVSKVVAGPTCSLAVVALTPRRHQIWGWGRVNGIWRHDHTHPHVFPDAFERALRSRRTGHGGPESSGFHVPDIVSLRVLDMSVGDEHAVLTVRVHGDTNAVVVFGSSKFGCLGIGNVVTYLEEERRVLREVGSASTTVSIPHGHSITSMASASPDYQINSSAADGKDGVVGAWTGSDQSDVVQGYPPLVVHSLTKFDITRVACNRAHTVAAAAGGSGQIFTWGSCANGRLGLGETNGKLVETSPCSIPQFDQKIIENQSRKENGGDAIRSEAARGTRDVAARGARSGGDAGVTHENPSSAMGVGGDASTTVQGGDGSDETGIISDAQNARATAAQHATGPADDGTRVAKRLRALERAEVLRSKINDQIMVYSAQLSRYSACLDRYTDQAELTRRTLLARLGQFHRIDRVRALRRIQTASHQPLPEEQNERTRGASTRHVRGLDNPYSLNAFERTIARLHCAPSELFGLVYLYERVKGGFSRGGDRREFVSVVYSIFDTHRTAHTRRLLIFLRLVIRHHHEAEKDWASFMAPNTIEWLMFKEAANRGATRRRLRSAMRLVLATVKWIVSADRTVHVDTKASAVRLSSVRDRSGSSVSVDDAPKQQQPYSNPYAALLKCKRAADIAEAKAEALGGSASLSSYHSMIGPLTLIKQMAEILVSNLTSQFIEPLMETIKDYGLVLLDVLGFSSRRAIIGEIIVRVFADFALDNLPSLLAPRGGASRVGPRCMRLLLHMTKGRQAALQHIEETLLSGIKDRAARSSTASRLIGTLEWLPAERQDERKVHVDETMSADCIFELYKTPFTRFVEYLRAERAKITRQSPQRSGFDAEGGLSRGLDIKGGGGSADMAGSPDKRDGGDVGIGSGAPSGAAAASFYSDANTKLLTDFVVARSSINNETLQVSVRAAHRFIAPAMLRIRRVEARSGMWNRMHRPPRDRDLWARTLKHELCCVLSEAQIKKRQDETDAARYRRETKGKKRRDKSTTGRAAARNDPWAWLARSPDQWRLIPGRIFMNVRLDLFMLDPHREISRDAVANTWTPRFSEAKMLTADILDDDTGSSDGEAGDVDAKTDPGSASAAAAASTISSTNQHRPPKVQRRARAQQQRALKPTETALEVSKRDCVRLWCTLKSARYRRILDSDESDAVWSRVLAALDAERQGALESKDNAHVEQLEWCRRALRRVVHRDKKMVVCLGADRSQQQGQDEARNFLNHQIDGDGLYGGVIFDDLDPLTLFSTLNAIDSRSLRTSVALSQHLEIIRSVNRELLRRTQALEADTKDLVAVFRRMSLPTRLERKGDSLAGFFITWKGPEDHSIVRRYGAVAEAMRKGNVVTRTYGQLLTARILIAPPPTLLDRAYARLVEWLPGSVVGACGSDVKRRQALFYEKLRFLFLTSHSPDLIDLRVLWHQDHLVTAQVRISSDHTLGNAGVSVWVGGRDVQGLISYSPLGTRAPIREASKLQFDLRRLHAFVTGNEFERPRRIFDAKSMIRDSGIERLLQHAEGS